MDNKTAIITKLREIFNSWELFISSKTDEQLVQPTAINRKRSIKDDLGHLMSWQQVSIARLEAALDGREPVFPAWLQGLEPESESDKEGFNQRIFQNYQQVSFTEVHDLWQNGFLRFIQLAEAIPEEGLLDQTKYTWLHGYPLFRVLQGSFEHHDEHLDALKK